MLHDLIVNMSLIISAIFVVTQFFKNYPIMSGSAWYFRVLGGLALGVLGVVQMFFGIRITDTTILDMRVVAIATAGLYWGLPASLSASILISIFRAFILHFNHDSIIAAVNPLIIGILIGLISNLPISRWRKGLYMNLVGTLCTTITFYLIIGFSHKFFNMLPYLWFFSLLTGYLAYYAVEYMVKSNRLFLLYKEQSNRDFLTGLHNIRSFDESLNMLIDTAIQRGERLSLLLIDIDHFKKVNDTYGHPAGDAVLRQLGTVLQKEARFSDLISRNGGEEFSILLPNCPMRQGEVVAERIRQAVERTLFILPDGTSIHITVSLGLATYPETIENTAEMLPQADEALYQAKRTGRNRVCVAKSI